MRDDAKSSLLGNTNGEMCLLWKTCVLLSFQTFQETMPSLQTFKETMRARDAKSLWLGVDLVIIYERIWLVIAGGQWHGIRAKFL